MIDRPLMIHIIGSTTVIVIGTLCVFYAEVGLTDFDWRCIDGYLDERWQSDTTRYHNDIHLFCLLRHVQRLELPVSGKRFRRRDQCVDSMNVSRRSSSGKLVFYRIDSLLSLWDCLFSVSWRSSIYHRCSMCFKLKRWVSQVDTLDWPLEKDSSVALFRPILSDVFDFIGVSGKRIS